MTPKEKAEELVNQFLPNTTSYYLYNGESINGGIGVRVEKAKKCALISVNEIMKAQELVYHDSDLNGIIFDQYWNQVKAEIEKL